MENTKTTTLTAIENGTFEFDASVPCIISSVRGFMPSEEFRPYMQKGLELIREKIKVHEKLGWMPDLTASDVFEPCDTEWLTSYWNPKAYEAGIRYIAFIMPESVFTQMNVEEYSEQTREKGVVITIGYFKDQGSAKNWLREALYGE